MAQQLRPLSRREVRLLDEQAESDLGLSTLVLMENAGRGAAEVLAQQMRADNPRGEERLPRVLILCGSGNNGGDGGVVARHLDGWGFPVQVLWLCHLADVRPDARVQQRILERSGVDQAAWFRSSADEPRAEELEALIRDADWLVDGLLGTGLTRPVDGIFRLAIEAMNRSGKPILALDLPSGLDADTGAPLGLAVKARLTATFVAPKLGFDDPGASAYTGEVNVVDIGLPRKLLAPFLRSSPSSGRG